MSRQLGEVCGYLRTEVVGVGVGVIHLAESDVLASTRLVHSDAETRIVQIGVASIWRREVKRCLPVSANEMMQADELASVVVSARASVHLRARSLNA